MASVYPGYTATPTVGHVIIGTLYGLLDGAIVAGVFCLALQHARRSPLELSTRVPTGE